MMRSYASVADPRGRDWAPRDPSPQGWAAPARPVRDRSPFVSSRRPPGFPPRAHRPAPMQRRQEQPRHRRGFDARPVFRPDVRDRDFFTGDQGPRHRVPPRPGPRPRNRPRPPRRPRPTETTAAAASAARSGPARLPPTHARPQVPSAQRSTDPDFAAKNRLVMAAIKAAHHLANATGPDPLPVISRLTQSLIAAIRPAVPSAATLALLEGNARNWAHTTTIVLRDHYEAAVGDKVSAVSFLPDPTWRRNFEVASSWANRQFGNRLRPETLESVRDRLRRTSDAPGPSGISASAAAPLPAVAAPLPLPPHSSSLAPPPLSGSYVPVTDRGVGYRDDDPRDRAEPELRLPSRNRSRSLSLFSSLSIPFTPPARRPPLVPPPFISPFSVQVPPFPSSSSPSSSPSSPPLLPLPLTPSPPPPSPPPPPPPAGSRPPSATPLPQRTSRVSAPSRRQPVATPLWTPLAPSGTTPGYGFAQAYATTPLRTSPAPSGTTPGHGFAQADATTPLRTSPAPSGTTPGHGFAQADVTTPLRTSPAPPGTTPGHGFAQADAPGDAVPAATPSLVVPARVCLTFDPPPDDVPLLLAIPDTPTRRPTRHANTTRKHTEWSLQAREIHLILGDSNLSRFPPFVRPGLQVESFPGATFAHAASVLGKTAVSPHVLKVVLAFGLNDRSHKTEPTTVRNLQRAIKMARAAFPRASVLVPEINFSRSLPHREQDNLRRLNEYIASRCASVPALSRNSFVTERDGIHWTRNTAALVLDHWTDALN